MLAILLTPRGTCWPFRATALEPLRPQFFPRGLCDLAMGQKKLLFYALLFLSVGSDISAATEGGPRLPCGEAPLPGYSTPGEPPTVRVWTDEEPSGGWDPPDCAGWTERAHRVLIALAGSFRHDGDVEDLLSRFGAVSALTGIRYWSVSDKAWQPLVTEATALSAPDAARRRSDFAVAEMVLGQVLYLAQRDNRSSGPVVYRMHLQEIRPGRLVIQTENVTVIRLWLLPLFGPGDVQVVYFLERLSVDVWGYYSLLRTDTASNLLRGGHEASYINRAVAFYRHLAGIPTDRDPPAAP
jgi:hypothetical protein